MGAVCATSEIDRGDRPGRRQERLEFEQLREIGAESKIPAYLIADKDGTRSQNVAGRNHRSHPDAPAPAILVEDVIEASSALGPVELTTLPGVGENVEFKLPAERNG
jgi:4-hydroxy-3-methylbut-2-en-1-yl diphosphate reductase